MFTNTSKVHDVVQEKVFPVMANIFYGVADEELLLFTLNRMMVENEHINSIVAYQFIADKETSIYKDQMVIASKSKNGVSPYIAGFKESVALNVNVQNILLNKIQYDNTKTINVLCENLFDINHVYSCEKFKMIDTKHKSVVSIPILDNDTFGVLGYVVITLDGEYNHSDVETLVNNTKMFIQRMERIIKHKN